MVRSFFVKFATYVALIVLYLEMWWLVTEFGGQSMGADYVLFCATATLGVAAAGVADLTIRF